MKIYFSYGAETRDGFTPQVPLTTSILQDESVDEIQGEGVIEKVPDLVAFIDECYRLLRPQGKAIFSTPHYASMRAWTSPKTIRGVGEWSLNFADKNWREANKFTECPVIANFEVVGAFALEEGFMGRAEDARQFMMKHYNNIAQCIIFTLTKR